MHWKCEQLQAIAGIKLPTEELMWQGFVVVDTPQVQNMVDRMITANLIHRQSHGVYAVADPFVRQV